MGLLPRCSPAAHDEFSGAAWLYHLERAHEDRR
jgi:hypothetical protein